MNTSEEFYLKWEDFQKNINENIRSLREEKDFSDVTLVCEDGQEMEVHKFILSASSPFFKEFLKRKNHPHPIILLVGIRAETLGSIIDFLYFGETKVGEKNLAEFMETAEKLKLNGLSFYPEGDESMGELDKTNSKVETNKGGTKEEPEPVSDVGNIKVEKATESNSSDPMGCSDIDLEAQIKSTMMKTGKMFDNGKHCWSCQVCGKESVYSTIKLHIEANHITGISQPCAMCHKVLRTRDALRQHKAMKHKTQ